VFTEDGVGISVRHDPPAGAVDAGDLCFVVVHGFTGSWRRPAVREVVRVLTETAGVVSLDLRGHGASDGETTLGRAEILDLDAAVRYARGLGYRHVVTVGFSLGSAVAVRHAALCGGVSAVVAVSGPSRWNYRGTLPMRVVHFAVNTAAGRSVLSWRRGTRVSRTPWRHDTEPPDALVGRIAPVPLLVVHGDADHYFPVEHGRWLVHAAGPTAELWEEPGFRHAESATAPELTRRIAAWGVASARMRP
jgi:pimeloyl-ACP methyl ester carboxylesterase